MAGVIVKELSPYGGKIKQVLDRIVEASEAMKKPEFWIYVFSAPMTWIDTLRDRIMMCPEEIKKLPEIKDIIGKLLLNFAVTSPSSILYDYEKIGKKFITPEIKKILTEACIDSVSKNCYYYSELPSDFQEDPEVKKSFEESIIEEFKTNPAAYSAMIRRYKELLDSPKMLDAVKEGWINFLRHRELEAISAYNNFCPENLKNIPEIKEELKNSWIKYFKSERGVSDKLRGFLIQIPLEIKDLPEIKRARIEGFISYVEKYPSSIGEFNFPSDIKSLPEIKEAYRKAMLASLKKNDELTGKAYYQGLNTGPKEYYLQRWSDFLVQFPQHYQDCPEYIKNDLTDKKNSSEIKTAQSNKSFDDKMKEKEFILPSRAKANGASLIWVDPVKFDEGFQKDDAYIGRGGSGGIGNRYETFAKFFDENRVIEVPEVSISKGVWFEKGTVGFINGRHRYAFMRDNGASKIPVALYSSPDTMSLQDAKKEGFVISSAKQGYKKAQKWQDDELVDPETFEIPTITVNTICYHGSCYKKNQGIFDNLSSDYSEWGATWVCPEENIAEEFAEERHGEFANNIPVVFRTKVKLNKAANIRPYEKDTWDQIMEALGFSDIRELIPYLKQKGCDGWITTGSLDTQLYYDIAVFYDNIDVLDVKVKINNYWTPYMKKNQVNHVLKTERESTISNSSNWYKTAQENDKVVYIMRGLPGSGKSTLAKELGQGGAVFSTDDVFMVDGKYRFNPSMLGYAHTQTQLRVKNAIESGISPIVVDNTNVKAWEAKFYVEEALKHGYRVEIKEPDTPWKFNAEELAKRNTHNIPLAAIESKLRKWEPNINVEDILRSKPPNRMLAKNNDQEKQLEKQPIS